MELGLKGLIAELSRNGVTISEFSRLTGVSYIILKKVDLGEEVRSSTIGRIKCGLEQVYAKRGKDVRFPENHTQPDGEEKTPGSWDPKTGQQ